MMSNAEVSTLDKAELSLYDRGISSATTKPDMSSTVCLS